MLGERDQLTHPALLVADHHELGPIDGDGVGLPALGPQLQGGVGELLGPIRLSLRQGVGGLAVGGGPHHGGLVKPRVGLPDVLEATACPVELRGLHRLLVRHGREQEDLPGVPQLPCHPETLGSLLHPLGVERGDLDGHVDQREGLDARRGVPDPLGHGHRLAGQVEAALECGRRVGELAAERGEEDGSIRAVAGRRGFECGFENGHPLCVDRPQGAEEPAAVGEGGPHEPCRIAAGPGAVGHVEQRLPVGGKAGLTLGDPQLES